MRLIAILILVFIWSHIAEAETIPLLGVDIIVDNKRNPEELISRVRTVMNTEGNLEDALEDLNALLLYPVHEYTQEASELIGIVYEKLGKIERAKAEYAAYLSLYPNSDSTTKIRQRLIALEIANPPKTINRLQTKIPRIGSEDKISGNISEYIYSGSSSTGVAQYSLISNTSLSGVFDRDEYKTKVIYRYTNLKNFTSFDSNRSKISVASVDVEDTYRDYSIKLGRQNSSSTGRFDGARIRYNLSDEVELNLETGIPYTGTTNTNRRFYSVGAGFNATSNLWLNLYYVYQLADTFPERSSIGIETRYYKNNTSITSVYEYDTLYRTMNSFLLQANIEFGSYTLYLLADKRKSPMLYADRALELGLYTVNHIPFTTVGELVAGSGIPTTDIYRYITESSPMSESYVSGLSKRINDRWIISSDLQITNISPTYVTSILTLDASPVMLNQAGTGNTYTINGRLLGTNIISKTDSLDLIVSKTGDNVSSSSAITVSVGDTIGNTHVDLLGRHFDRNQGDTYSTIDTISFRLITKINEKISIDSQISVDHGVTHDKLMQTQSSTNSKILFVGLRYDF